MPSQPSYNGPMMLPFPGLAAVPPLAANLPAPVASQTGAEANDSAADAPMSDAFAALLGPLPAARPTDALRASLLPAPTLTTGRPQLFLPLNAIEAQPMPAPQAASSDAAEAAEQAVMGAPPEAPDRSAPEAGTTPPVPSQTRQPEQTATGQMATTLSSRGATTEPTTPSQLPATLAAPGPDQQAAGGQDEIELAAAPWTPGRHADTTMAQLNVAQAPLPAGEPVHDAAFAPATVNRPAAPHHGRSPQKALPAQSAPVDRHSLDGRAIPIADMAPANLQPVNAMPDALSEGLGVQADTPSAPAADQHQAVADQAGAPGLQTVSHAPHLLPKGVSLSAREGHPDAVAARRDRTVRRVDAPVSLPSNAGPVLPDAALAEQIERAGSSVDRPPALPDHLGSAAGVHPFTEQVTSPQLRTEPGVALQPQPQQARTVGNGSAAEPAAVDPQPSAPPRAAETVRAPAEVAVSSRSLEGLRELDVRLMQPDIGRVDVRLSIPEKGRLEAVVASDNPAALDLLRREGVELARALAAAAPSSDGASLSFQSRSSDEQPGRRGPGRHRSTSATPVEDTPAEWRPIATSGRIERIA